MWALVTGDCYFCGVRHRSSSGAVDVSLAAETDDARQATVACALLGVVRLVICTYCDTKVPPTCMVQCTQIPCRCGGYNQDRIN